MSAVRVHALGASSSYETATDSQGLCEFRDLRPGTYTIKVEYPKGTILRFLMAYGKTSGRFDFSLASDTRISGRVLDPNGHPTKGVCLEIEALHRDARKGSGTYDYTEADGSYALAMVPPGSYRIVANRDGRITAAEPFGRLYRRVS